jgi:hypothetical protein
MMGTVYIFDDCKDGVSVSAFPTTSEEYETNHMTIRVNGTNSVSVMLNVVRNVLQQTGVEVVME